MRREIACLCLIVLGSCGGSGSGGDDGSAEPLALLGGNPILFCTQTPNPVDFTTIASSFGNHGSSVDACPRGGDLCIRYPNGTIRKLTALAGWGQSGLQGAQSIAVREPCVHWSGNKALFSMVVGSPGPGATDTSRWQIYEVSGLGINDTPLITRVAHQPEEYNNISPIYGSDDSILFTSDRPRNGRAHLYPQLDEYEEVPTVTGVWKLDPVSGDLHILNHTPSGAFSPGIDSFGRVIFTRWDHLVRDQQADDDNICQCNQFGTFNYASESADAISTGSNDEVFPEPRPEWLGHVGSHMPGYSGEMNGYQPYLTGSEVNHFFPWMMNQDGSGEETLNHIGRHELHAYIPLVRVDDPNIVSQLQIGPFSANQTAIPHWYQLREDPNDPGSYFAINAPEFFTHGAGQVVRIHAPPGLEADDVTTQMLTHPDTANYDTTPGTNHSGMYRSILPLTNGKKVVVHAATTQPAGNLGSGNVINPVYKFRLRELQLVGNWHKAGAALTRGITKSVSWYRNGQLMSFQGALWELWPVEVAARAVPQPTAVPLEQPEQQILDEEGVSSATLRAFLRSKGLALIVSRNVTRRDRNDLQQPFNLRVTEGGVQTIAKPGRVYDISHLQIFQADQIRGLTMGGSEPIPGRRALAQALHDPTALAHNPPDPDGPSGSVRIAADGSMAALVPARRALSWQLTDPMGEPVVRERYWLTFQPGEIRTCAACHVFSSADQNGNGVPRNPPQALGELLQHLKDTGAF
ncbi:MAG: hypothetical protein RL277_2740 [Planctomycetota bacterium]